jgi:hypothetical protein
MLPLCVKNDFRWALTKGRTLTRSILTGRLYHCLQRNLITCQSLRSSCLYAVFLDPNTCLSCRRTKGTHDEVLGDALDHLLLDGGLRVGFVLLLPEVEWSAKLNDFRCESSGMKHSVNIGVVSLVASGVCELHDSVELFIQ